MLLANYPETHFEEEEALMQKIKFPDFVCLYEQHRLCVSNVEQFRAEFEAEETTLRKIHAGLF
jgi:hemerythrin